MEALKAEDSTKTYKWEYFVGKYGHFTAHDATTRTWPGGIDSIARFGHGGMNGWGATCGIPIALAMVAQQAMSEGAALNNIFDQIFANYGQAAHPQADVSNAEWFYSTAGVRHGAVAPPATGSVQISRMALPAVKVGSMQCHNAVEQYIKLGDAFSPKKGRQEWCGRLVADQCYLALKLINNAKRGTPYDATTLSAVPATCHTAACHVNTQGRVVGKEDCLVCHK